MHIGFRSKYAKVRQIGNSSQKNIASGVDWSGISEYQLSDDAKNIVWKKSTAHHIYKKNYEEFGKISLLLVFIESESDNFCVSNGEYFSRKNWKKKSQKILSFELRRTNILFKILSFKNIPEFLSYCQKYKIQKNLILFFSDIFLEKDLGELGKIAKLNEFIWIHSYHPFEKNPIKENLFFGKIFNIQKQKQYQEAIAEYETLFQKALEKIHIPLIITQTNVNIDKTLYHFFKYQYE